MRPLTSLVLVAGALLLVGGAPARAQLAISPGSVSVAVPQGQVVAETVTVMNAGSEAASFCLSFDRPLQRQGQPLWLDAGGERCGTPGELLSSVTNASAGIGWDPYGLTMTPDGRIFVASYANGRTHELTPDLEVVRYFMHPRVAELTPFARTVGLVYNADTGTLWWSNAEIAGLEVRRIMLLEGDLDGVPTGRRVVLPLVPGPPPYAYGYPQGASYDPATGLFYYVDGLNDTLWAIDTLGVVPPGYPAEQTAYPGAPLGNGVDAHGGAEGGPEGVRLEVAVALPGGGIWDRVVVLDRFGNDLGGPAGSETPLPTFSGSTGGGMNGNPLRSRLDPNGVLYVAYSNFEEIGVAAVRPAPLSPSWLLLSAWRGTLGPGESAEVALTFSAGARAVGDYAASLQVIHAETGAVAEVPLVLTVTQGTAVEGGPEGDPSLTLSVYPNPASGAAAVALALPDEARMTVGLYDVLGRRVALLHEGAIGAGRHAFPVEGSSLPAGVYLVRVETLAVSGAEREAAVVTRRLTVVR